MQLMYLFICSLLGLSHKTYSGVLNNLGGLGINGECWKSAEIQYGS